MKVSAKGEHVSVHCSGKIEPPRPPPSWSLGEGFEEDEVGVGGSVCIENIGSEDEPDCAITVLSVLEIPGAEVWAYLA